MIEEVQKHSVQTLVFRSLKRTHDMFLSNQGILPPIDEKAEKLKKSIKSRDNYVQVLDKVLQNNSLKKRQQEEAEQEKCTEDAGTNKESNKSGQDLINEQVDFKDSYLIKSAAAESMALALTNGVTGAMQAVPGAAPNAALQTVPGRPNTTSSAIAVRKAPAMPKPKWHPPWKLYRVISGHLGWVRCVAVEPGNEWFATGSADRVIKIWELATGRLKVSLTGHISSVRGLAVSSRHPYLFSCGEDRQVKCWDLEYNKVIRHYHGHLSAVYTLTLHPTIDVLITAGRDSTARVWDMRAKANVHTFSGHTNTVASVISQAAEPQEETERLEDELY